MAGDIEEDEAEEEEDDVEDVEDDEEEGGVRPATTGVTGADCAHEVRSEVRAPARIKCFGLDVLLSDVKDTVEPVFLLGVSHDDHVPGDKVGGLDDGGLTTAEDVALGNKE